MRDDDDLGFSWRVRSVLLKRNTGLPTIDCREAVGRCAIRFMLELDTKLTYHYVNLAFAADASVPMPQITAAPSTGLTDGQVIHATVSGFPLVNAINFDTAPVRLSEGDADIPIDVWQCVDEEGGPWCDFASDAPTAQPSGGSVAVDFRVSRVTCMVRNPFAVSVPGRTVDCTMERCFLGVFLRGALAPWAQAPIQFAPEATPSFTG